MSACGLSPRSAWTSPARPSVCGRPGPRASAVTPSDGAVGAAFAALTFLPRSLRGLASGAGHRGSKHGARSSGRAHWPLGVAGCGHRPVRALSSFPLCLRRLRFRPPEPLWVFAADCPSVSWPHGLARARDECSRLPCLQSRGDGAQASPRVLTMSKSTLRDPPAPRSRLPIDPPCGGQAGPVPSSNFTCSRPYS